MPTYEYVCRDCGHHLEVVQSFRDEPLRICERCQGALRKVFSAAGIIFKGSGYYVTDTRAAAKRAAAGSSASADSSNGSSDTSSSSDSSGSSDSSSSSESTARASKSA